MEPHIRVAFSNLTFWGRLIFAWYALRGVDVYIPLTTPADPLALPAGRPGSSAFREFDA